MARKCVLGHMANLYLGMQGRLAEVAPKPGHHCCTPAAQLELLLSATAQLCCAEEVTPCIRDHPVHKGPPHAQGTIPCTRDHPPYTRGHPMHKGPSCAQGTVACTRGHPLHKGPPHAQGTTHHTRGATPCTGDRPMHKGPSNAQGATLYTRDRPMHNGPQQTTYQTPDNFYFPFPIHSAPRCLFKFNKPLWNLGLGFGWVGTCAVNVDSTKGRF